MYGNYDTIRKELFDNLGADCKVSLLVVDAWYEWSAVILRVGDDTVWLYRNPTPTQQGERVEVPISWVMAVE